MQVEVIKSKNKVFIKDGSGVKLVNLDDQNLNMYYENIDEMPDEERCEMLVAQAMPKALRKFRYGTFSFTSERQH